MLCVCNSVIDVQPCDLVFIGVICDETYGCACMCARCIVIISCGYSVTRVLFIGVIVV